MAVIERFLGQPVEVPDHFRYQIKQGLWARKTDSGIVFGLTQPALVLMGGIKDIEGLVNDGADVKSGDSVAFAITRKILYIDTPLGGTIQYNQGIPEKTIQIEKDPYGNGWLFQILPQDDIDNAYNTFVPMDIYLESLRATDGLKNPLGLKGGVSGMCKAVYSGIGEQKL